MKRPLSYRVQDFFFDIPITRKWGCILHGKRHYGFPVRDLISMWAEAKDAVKRPDPIFGDTMTDAAEFFSRCAHRRDEEADNYRCVYGTCVVIWHQGKNIGGYGRAGCPCDNMDDPRGELIDRNGDECATGSLRDQCSPSRPPTQEARRLDRTTRRR